MTSIAGSLCRLGNALKLCVICRFSFLIVCPSFSRSLPRANISFARSLSSSAHSPSSCARSFFSSNQVGGRHKLTESSSSNNQNRLCREQSQGHNETLGARGGLTIKSYYAAAMAPMSEWEPWSRGGSIHGEQHKWVTRKRGVCTWDTGERGG